MAISADPAGGNQIEQKSSFNTMPWGGWSGSPRAILKVSTCGCGLDPRVVEHHFECGDADSSRRLASGYAK